MTKDELDEIIEIKKEIKDIEERVSRLETKLQKIKEHPAVSDTVTTGATFPYTLHSFLVQGISESDQSAIIQIEKDILQHKRSLEKRVKRLSPLQNKVEKAILRIKDCQCRRIAEFYYFDGVTYEGIAESMNISTKTVQRKMKKFLQSVH